MLRERCIHRGSIQKNLYVRFGGNHSEVSQVRMICEWCNLYGLQGCSFVLCNAAGCRGPTDNGVPPLNMLRLHDLFQRSRPYPFSVQLRSARLVPQYPSSGINTHIIIHIHVQQIYQLPRIHLATPTSRAIAMASLN